MRHLRVPSLTTPPQCVRFRFFFFSSFCLVAFQCFDYEYTQQNNLNIYYYLARAPDTAFKPDVKLLLPWISYIF